MRFRTRAILATTGLLAAAVLTTAGVLTWVARQSMLAQSETYGLMIADLLGRSTDFAQGITYDVEDVIGEQMVTEARFAAHLMAMATATGVPVDQVSARLRDIVGGSSALDEIWITDESGKLVSGTVDRDFTFSPDESTQPQAHEFWRLLTGKSSVVIQPARKRDIDDVVMKYVGVGGVDRPRIVQVGYEVGFLDELRRKVGVRRLIDEMIASGSVVAIHVVDPEIKTVAFSAKPGLGPDKGLSDSDKQLVRKVVAEKKPVSYVEGSVLKLIAPVGMAPRAGGVAASLVELPIDDVLSGVRQQMKSAALAAAVVLLFGLLSSIVMARRVTEPIARLTEAAEAVEQEQFVTQSLGRVAARKDEIGQLARVFQRMAHDVQVRADRLKQQLHALRIEVDQTKKTQQLAEITETEYFHALLERAKDLRKKHS